MTAGEFFEGLRRIGKGADDAEFRKGSQTVRNYPSKLSVRIASGPRQCHDHLRDEDFTHEIGDFMDSLSFKAEWKRGTELRPVKGLVINSRRREVRETDVLGPMVSMTIWIYEMTLESKDVPLTDHLIISVFSSDGKRIARMSASV